MPNPKERARHLRRNSTGPEKKLWSILRNRNLGGLKFRRQYPIKPYFADFCCFEKKLIVEVDGESHEGQQAYDAQRQQFLESEGYQVVRVSNDDVLQNLDGVAEMICHAAAIPW